MRNLQNKCSGMRHSMYWQAVLRWDNCRRKKTINKKEDLVVGSQSHHQVRVKLLPRTTLACLDSLGRQAAVDQLQS